MWSVKTGGLWWQVQLYLNVGPSGENAWSVKTGGLWWQLSQDSFHCITPQCWADGQEGFMACLLNHAKHVKHWHKVVSAILIIIHVHGESTSIMYVSGWKQGGCIQIPKYMTFQRNITWTYRSSSNGRCCHHSNLLYWQICWLLNLLERHSGCIVRMNLLRITDIMSNAKQHMFPPGQVKG